MYDFIFWLSGVISVIAIAVFLMTMVIAIVIKITGDDFFDTNYTVEFKISNVVNVMIVSVFVSIFVIMMIYESINRYKEFQTHYKIEPITKEVLYKNDNDEYYKDTLYVYPRKIVMEKINK